MTQVPLEWSLQPDIPLEELVTVALDLETTGLDPRTDRIIEVGAVKFAGDSKLATFSALVNPHMALSRFVSELTGIRQADIDAAPTWDAVAGGLAEFIGDHPLVGHRVSFDIAFLKNQDVQPAPVSYDTYELASVLIPEGPDYSLGGLSARFEIGHDSPHRALSDALATRDLFNLLLAKLRDLDPAVLRQLERLGQASGWTVGDLARRVLAGLPPSRRRSRAGPLGVDRVELARRLRVPPADDGGIDVQVRSPDQVGRIFGPDGELAGNLPDYDYRPQQAEMSEAVTDAIENGGHLIVEAGTGVGKSLAYLVPGALHALATGHALVVTTNTINLQEQLVQKDLPAVERVLETLGIPVGTLRIAQLKGRSNYICFRRWAYAQATAEPDADTARVMGKCLTWLQSTTTGDRSEISLPRRDSAIFSRLSAQGAEGCPAPEGPCFLRRARFAAQSAHIIVINHALLMSDIAMGGGIVPPHAALIVDEAHHLEAVATRHLGFQVVQTQFESDLEALGGSRGVLSDAIRAITGGGGPSAERATETANTLLEEVGRAGRGLEDFYGVLGRAVEQLLPKSGGAFELRVTPATRVQPVWSDLEVAWENVDLVTGRIAGGLRMLADAVPRAAARGDEAAEATGLNLSASFDAIESTRVNLRQAIAEPEGDTIYWLTPRRYDGTVTVNAAPLRVGPILAGELFARERCTVLTSGSLSTGEGFGRLRTSLGVPEASELALGSPFDYRRAVLVAAPIDIPEPGRQGYNAAIAEAIYEVALAARDRMLVLFTSNSALYAARDALKERLGLEGVKVVGQGPDGTPYRIMRALAADKQTVALGTRSLWEGVDLEGASIKTLVMTRLPFPVPSEPVFEARSEQYEDSFGEYAVPEAVMRFKQGFGRLIRRRSDRGAFLVLDGRIASKSYGRRFLQALPDCTFKRLPARALGPAVREWLA